MAKPERRVVGLAVGLAVAAMVFLGRGPVRTALGGTTERVSVASGGAPGNGHSSDPALSADGRFVAFWSDASNLVAGDTNGVSDVFVHDRDTGATTRVSVASDATQGNWYSWHPSLSGDGRFVAFASASTNLVPVDFNPGADIFVHDRQTGQTTLVSIAADGSSASGESFHPAISADGRFVAFESYATNLVPDHTSGLKNIFVHDRHTGETTRVSVPPEGGPGLGESEHPSISADGRFVAFASEGADFLARVFVHDRQTGETTHVSVASDGTEGNGMSRAPSLSADGRFVAFVSMAQNLVPDDTNHADDVFVHDRLTSETSCLTLASDGPPGAAPGAVTGISADGRFVAFSSYATNLVPDDTNGLLDVFVHDRQTGQTTRATIASDGTESDTDVRPLVFALSADGRVVAFRSAATTLVPGDTNDCRDIFVRDRGQDVPLVVHTDDSNTTGIETGTQWQPFNTITEGLAAVGNGGAVEVAQGTYAESLVVTGKQATILGGYPGGTYPGTGDFSEANRDPVATPSVIDGNGTATQVICQDAAARGSTLDGLTIRNGGAIFRGGVVLKRVIAKAGP